MKTSTSIISMESSSNLFSILRTVSVEPIIFLISLALAFHNVVYSYGIYRVICQKMYGDDIGVDCSDLSNSTYGTVPELQVQKATADWSIQYALAYMIPATFTDIILGALGDRYGRKFNIQLGIFGLILAVFPVAIIFSYPSTTPMYTLLIANIISGLTGFSSIVVISSYAYLADTIIDKNLLTIRMTLMQVFSNAGTIFGPLLTSAVSKVLNRSAQEIMVVMMLALAFVIGWIVLRQIPPETMRRKMTEGKEGEREGNENGKNNQAIFNNNVNGSMVEMGPDLEMATHSQSECTPKSADSQEHSQCKPSTKVHEDQNSNDIKSCEKLHSTGIMSSEHLNSSDIKLSQHQKIFHSTKTSPSAPDPNDKHPTESKYRLIIFQLLWSCPQLMKEVWSTYSRPRQGRTRAYIIAASAVIFVQLAADLGLRHSIFTLYVQKAPLNWNQDTIGFYNSAYGALTTLGTALGILVFKKILLLADTSVVLIALASGVAECFLIAFGPYTWVIFVSSVVGCLTSLIKPCLKSYVAKLVDPNEVGKAFTVFGLAQNMAYLTSAIIFNSIYKATLEWFPGFVYVFASVWLLVVFGLIVWVHVDEKKAAGEKWNGVKSLNVWICESRVKKTIEV